MSFDILNRLGPRTNLGPVGFFLVERNSCEATTEQGVNGGAAAVLERSIVRGAALLDYGIADPAHGGRSVGG